MRSVVPHPFRALTGVIGILAGALACGGSSGDPAGPGPGPVACGGTPAGTFTATINGTPFSATLATQASAANGTAIGPNVIQVGGVECPAGGVPGRQIVISLGRLTPLTTGTYPLDAASQGIPSGSGYFGTGSFVHTPNQWYTNRSDATGPGSGSITFTTVSATRLAGTFQMIAVAPTSNAASAQGRATITNGSFDLPLR